MNHIKFVPRSGTTWSLEFSRVISKRSDEIVQHEVNEHPKGEIVGQWNCRRKLNMFSLDMLQWAEWKIRADVWQMTPYDVITPFDVITWSNDKWHTLMSTYLSEGALVDLGYRSISGVSYRIWSGEQATPYSVDWAPINWLEQLMAALPHEW